MPQVVIENPILNSPFSEPKKHFKFSEEGITNEIVESRRTSSYFVPIARTKRQGKQMVFDTEWTQDRIEENKLINQIRERVAIWRQGKYQGTTKTTARLLEYWQRPDRSRKLFFCQLEAVETAIYITEIAKKYGDSWIENELRRANDEANPLLYRLAFKMATGSGKTVVMAMLIAWQALNKIADQQNTLFSDTFLIVTPGITIKDRLRVLLPNDPQNYYRQMDIVSSQDARELDKAKILITNYHAFLLRETIQAGKITKTILRGEATNAFTETPDQMVRRVCRELGNKKNIVVINDEAHHCYRHKATPEDEQLAGDERKEAEEREKAARVWISGLEAIKEKIGIKMICDLSATPFFLRGSGYPEGTLFQWVVSDFSLIDAIESGIVKVPRVPVADNSMVDTMPTYRELWLNIREHLPRRGRSTQKLAAEPLPPIALAGALESLYENYKKYYAVWESNTEAREKGSTPPVFIVVCNNTNVSKLVYDYISGWEKTLPDGATVPVPGKLPLFSNVDGNRWLNRPNTILIDSEQLESGEAMSADFKEAASREIAEFKDDYRLRFPGRDIESITDEDLLREVMNTVGKTDKLGEQVKCVVSVSMLTEGWDANTVTHILGVRAFGTQLLCEQVVGRGLRRRSYVADEKGMLSPEYAEVYGVPFSFIPCSGTAVDVKPGPIPTRVRALEERSSLEITFPRLIGYRYQLPSEKLTAKFTEETAYSLSTQDIPTRVEVHPIAGEIAIHTLDDLKARREQEVAFLLSKLVLEKYFKKDDGGVPLWLYPQIVEITRQWMTQCLTCKDDTFPQLLLLGQLAHSSADRIYKAIVSSVHGEKTLQAILAPYDTVGSTKYVNFDTTREVYKTHSDKCHVSYVALDSGWEAKLAQSLESMEEVICYVKNQNLGFVIPYPSNGVERHYYPDYIVRINDGKQDNLNLIIEVTGEKKKEKADKVAAAKTLWVPAVNNHGGFGRWAFLEITDPWNAIHTIREWIFSHAAG